jgi:hypothetical protein
MYLQKGIIKKLFVGIMLATDEKKDLDLGPNTDPYQNGTDPQHWINLKNEECLYFSF